MAENPVQHELSGLSAVVTGSSSGIGRAMALELASAGADVLVHARRSRDRAEAVASEIRAFGREACVVLADLADPRGQDQLAHEAWAWHDRVDIWINNAGVDVLTGDAAGWSFEQKLEALWQVDVIATLRLSRRIGRLMKERGQGTILNIGWDQAETGMAGDSGELFATTKGAVMAFTKSLARSLAPQVRVNCLAPGWIRTSWGDQASAYWHDRAKRECLLERWGTPEDVARVARFLVSQAAAFVTGQIIPVNGGLGIGQPARR
jgi:3-oxoacyl-[acyl-carrier protein] reductase